MANRVLENNATYLPYLKDLQFGELFAFESGTEKFMRVKTVALQGTSLDSDDYLYVSLSNGTIFRTKQSDYKVRRIPSVTIGPFLS